MKHTIDYGCGIAELYTPYKDVENRFYELAGTCFGIRKNIMYVKVIKTTEEQCSDFERLEFSGDVYVWREDGAKKMLEPWESDEWDTAYCAECGRKKIGCKWLQDEICCNDKCPVCCDFCPVVNYPGVCRFEVIDDDGATS